MSVVPTVRREKAPFGQSRSCSEIVIGSWAKMVRRSVPYMRDLWDRSEAAARDTVLGHGVQFNDVDQDPFRDKLRSAGFYADWHKKFGDEAWALLEKYSGKLA